MRQLSTIVGVPLGVVEGGRQHTARCRSIAAKLVGDQPPRFFPLAFQDLAEEAFSRPGVATWLGEDIEYISVLINGPPQVVLASADA